MSLSLLHVAKLLQPSSFPKSHAIKSFNRNYLLGKSKQVKLFSTRSPVSTPVGAGPLRWKGTVSTVLCGVGVSAFCVVTWKRWSTDSSSIFVVKAEAKNDSNGSVVDEEDIASPFVAECAGAVKGRKRRNSAAGNKDAVAAREEEEEDVEFDWKQFGDVLKPYWVFLTVSVVSAVAVAIINIEIPHVLGQIVDVVTTKILACNGNQTNEIIASNGPGATAVISGVSRSETFEFLVRGPALKLLSLYLLQSGFTFSYIYSLSVVGEGVASELRRRLFSALLHQPISWWDKQMTGQVVGRLSSDVQEFKSSFKAVISQGLRSVSQAFGCVVSLLLISPEMTQTIVAIVPVIILVGSVFGRGLRALSKRAQEQVAVSSGHAEEALANIRTVRAFAMEKEEEEKYAKALADAEALNLRLGIGIGAFQGGSTLFLNGLVLAVLYTGGQLISNHSITSGELMSFLVAAQTIQKSLSNLSLLFGQCVRGLGAGARVFEYINLPKDPNFSGGGTGEIIENVKGDLEFHNVWFKYPSRMDGDYVLKRFSLRIPHGKVVAVVGASGCGKSTLVNLLELFYPCEKGEITLDSVRLETVDSLWVRGSVFGLISQEPTLFAESIKENIRYGKPSATDEEVYEAARQANAYSFIMEMPSGFDTRVGERGVTVSGGQKQRIAIARALIKDPKVLILDEATSALDSESEAVVQATLEKVQKGRTVLVIAHRLSTVQNADLIAVVEDGRVAELGTHTELKRKKGLYYNFVKTQEYKAKTGHNK